MNKSIKVIILSKLNPDKLKVDFRRGVTQTEPIIPRQYTLTHSDVTGELFLAIGPHYAKDKITPMRDEVLGKWAMHNGNFIFNVYLHVDGTSGVKNTAIRDKIFRRELPLALEAIRYGDRKFFCHNTYLDNAPIMVYFNSALPQYKRIENWGTFSEYRVSVMV